jgi:hypothetical protein
VNTGNETLEKKQGILESRNFSEREIHIWSFDQKKCWKGIILY